jgi:hypothetical protein
MEEDGFDPDPHHMRERLVRIETKLDLYIVNGIQDHETRIRQLERWKYAIPASILTGITSAGTAVWIALGR